MLNLLRSAVESHTGQFVCSEIHNKRNTKLVTFAHEGTPPVDGVDLPDVPGLREFYATFGSLTLYLDAESGDAAYHLAGPAEWAELDDSFRDWFHTVDEADLAEFLPDWVENCVVVGEVPRSGNYLLVATTGAHASNVFLFDHDGFEFEQMGNDLPDFVLRTLAPDSRHLTNMASHMRFITADGRLPQWWIEELRDNRGNVVPTSV